MEEAKKEKIIEKKEREALIAHKRRQKERVLLHKNVEQNKKLEQQYKIYI